MSHFSTIRTKLRNKLQLHEALEILQYHVKEDQQPKVSGSHCTGHETVEAKLVIASEFGFHMKRELGDIMWYVAQACMALDTDFDEIIEMNVDKLKKRYPGGEFDVKEDQELKVSGSMFQDLLLIHTHLSLDSYGNQYHSQ